MSLTDPYAPTAEERHELCDLYALARIATKDSRWHRLVYTAKAFVERHPQFTEVQAYKMATRAIDNERIAS